MDLHRIMTAIYVSGLVEMLKMVTINTVLLFMREVAAEYGTGILDTDLQLVFVISAYLLVLFSDNTVC